MATRGETINQMAPIVAITGATSGSITFNPATAASFRRVGSTKSGTSRVMEYVAQGANNNKQHDTIVGIATVTITKPTVDKAGNVVTTKVHYRIGPKNPTSHGVTSSTRVTDKYVSESIIYGTAFTIKQARPGSNVTTLRLRTYKVANQTKNGATVSGISPNEKSEVVIIKFVHKT